MKIDMQVLVQPSLNYKHKDAKQATSTTHINNIS